jgi:hypothetical protein
LSRQCSGPAGAGKRQILPPFTSVVTLTKPLPSLYWQWRLWAGVRPGGWVGSAPGLKAGNRVAERGSWRVGGAATVGSWAQREEPKSQKQPRNILGTCLQHPCNYGDDPVALRCWQGEACGLGPASWLGCLATPSRAGGRQAGRRCEHLKQAIISLFLEAGGRIESAHA